MRAYLRPAPADDLRPTVLASNVIATAGEVVRPHIAELLKAGGRPVHPEALTGALAIAFQSQSDPEPYRVAKRLESVFGWPVTYELVRLVAKIAENLPVALKIEAGRWCARTGHRFPAKDGEIVEYTDATGTQEFAGRVVAVDRTTASAIVQPVDVNDQDMVGQPYRVYAETVYANVTRGEYAFATLDGGMAVLPEPEPLPFATPAPAQPVFTDNDPLIA